MAEILKNEIEPNLELNDSELLFSRVENPEIRRQFVDLLTKAFHSIGADPKETVADLDGFMQEKIDEAKKGTGLDFYDEDTGYYDNRIDKAFISLARKNKDVKATSITEAHKKGHQIRGFLFGDNPRFHFCEKFFTEYFSVGFDFDKLIDEYDENKYEKDLIKYGLGERPDWRDWRAEKFRYLREPWEIVERMSQLKNYFGMTGVEAFTTDHLKYAKENYIKDNGMDNLMSEFFEAIAPEKEADFIRLINSSGI